jgi:hypothetical protein
MGEIMQRCGGCRRHVAMRELVCPFCRAPVGRVVVASAPAIAVVAISTMLFACGEPQGGDSGGDSAGTETSAGDATQGMSSTSAPTATEGSASTLSDSGVDSSTSELDTDMTAGGFIYGAPDLGGALVECDVFAQDCPADEKCQPWANDGGDTWNRARCSPVQPDASDIGEPCHVEGQPQSGVDDCAFGAFCWVLDAEASTGVCVEQCRGSSSEPECAGTGTCAVIEPMVVAVCAPSCDLEAPMCDGTDVCTPVGDAAYCLPDAAGDG